MKTKKSILSLLALFATLLVSAQANFDFNRYALVSGTDRQQGAVYRFPSVKTGVDAIVTIDKLTSSASLGSINFSGAGFAALKPELSIAPHCWGYAKFNIQFVATGTSTPVAMMNIPQKGKKSGWGSDNHKEVKLDVVSSSATSFKVRMYMVNLYGYTLNKKADVFLQKFNSPNAMPSETAGSGFPGDAKGN
jgi:hypothetical protein